ncbi:MAG: thioester reductase domain-containing protein [Alphaproteobacteria bacterium]|nr:thioester reductase domain-containing protein [Alphaproteobacteria bacterium]
MDLVSVLDAIVDSSPEQPLFHYYDARGRLTESFTRAAFQARTFGIARGMAEEAGVRRGDRVVLAYPSCTETIAAYFAALRLGAIPVPVPALGQKAGHHRVAQVVEDCAPTALLTNGGTSTDLVATFDSRIWADARADDVASAPIDGDDIALLQYTSGSTSVPKGVMVTHANILHNCSVVLDHPPVAVTWLPQHHDLGLIGYCLFPALAGGEIHGFSPATFIARPQLWLELITRVKATATSAPNFAYDLVLDRTDISDLVSYDLSSMRIMQMAAETIRPDTYSRFLRALAPRGLDSKAFYVAYGLAEATLGVTSYGSTALPVARKDLARGQAREAVSVSGIAAATRLMSCGRPLGNTRLAIVDPSSRKSVSDGTVGEIWISGGSVAAGYWQKEDASLKTFGNKLNGDAWNYLATGDLGFIHKGELVVCGRSKDVIIVRGQNFHPSDIEVTASFALAGGGADVAAIEVHQEGAPNRIVLLVEEKRRQKVRLEDAANAVQVDLGIELDEVLLVPSRALPRTTSGKLRRHLAGSMLLDGLFEVRERWVRPERFSEPGETPFAWLLQRYGLTGDETENFAQIGISSLDLVGVMHELQELLTTHGGEDLIAAVDVRMIQRTPVRRLVALAAATETATMESIARLRHEVALDRAEARKLDAQCMAADAKIVPAFPPVMPPPAQDGKTLLTGATGFLGPFLLLELAKRGRDVVAMVRGADADSARARLRRSLESSGISRDWCDLVEAKTEIVLGDLAAPGLGLSGYDRDRIESETSTIVHNGAVVNYLFDYLHMRDANVEGTKALLELAAGRRTKVFNHISTTFIFGWATKPVLLETDGNTEMALLDFGYSQSKWSSERIVANAAKAGLPTRIFRPALITPSTEGGGNAFDITIRLLKFMIDHGVGVSAQNQVSFTPVDIVAANVVGISDLPYTLGETFHVVRDDFATMRDVTDRITDQTGRPFEHFALREFVPEVIRRCTRRDILFPLLDFLINSVDNISSMEFKRYDSSRYQEARARAGGLPDPSLDDTVGGILRFMRRQGLDQP